MKKFIFAAATFFIFRSFKCFLLVLITFLANFDVFFAEIKKSKMADLRGPPFRDHNAIPYDVIKSRCGPQRKHFWTYYVHSSFVVIA